MTASGATSSRKRALSGSAGGSGGGGKGAPSIAEADASNGSGGSDHGAPSSSAASLQYNAREVKSKLSDFAHYMDSMASEYEKSKQDLAESKDQLRRLKNSADSAREDHEREVERLRSELDDKEEALHVLRAENACLHVKVGEMAADNSELESLRWIVSSAKSQLRDYITLDSSGVSLLTTTGQVTNFEGIVNQWMNTLSFNGEPSAQFQCPITRKPTSLLLDQGVTAFVQRMGVSLGLSATPPFYFRYSRYEVEEGTVETDIHDWETYTMTDQLALMAKVVFNYQHRETNPSFALMLRDNHLIHASCSRFSVPGQATITHRFTLSMHVVSTHMRSHIHTPHAIQFVIAHGTQNPFPCALFEWAQTPTIHIP